MSRGPLNRHQEQETSRNIVLLQSRFITHFASLVSRIFRTSVKSSIGMLVRNSNPPAIGVQPLTTQQPESLGEVIQTNLFITHTRYESREWELAKLQSARMANPFSNLSMIGLTNREPAAYKRGFPHPTMQDNKAFSEDTSSIYHAPAMELVKPYEESTRAHNQSTKYNKAETNSAYSQGQSPILDINRLTDQVYQAIERKIRIERERRGL
ncbi:hypothetical protein [Brevibacillus sp. SYSU BS000544]|uniref:hypothetical protein n=1 Tax=Brevibacillus sp. SYSU BS000544 TaxID=3416443 RepID=UPI003CE4B55F